MKRYLPFIIILIVLVAVIGIFSVTLRRGNGGADSGLALSNSNQPPPIAGSGAAPNQPAPASAVPTKPNVKVSSPVVLEEYGDYQCPPCGQLYPELKQIEHEYGDQVQIVFHHFPLAKIHKNALVAAGIGADRVKTVSFGKEKPFCTESNEACWQQNRRGHFVYAK